MPPLFCAVVLARRISILFRFSACFPSALLCILIIGRMITGAGRHNTAAAALLAALVLIMLPMQQVLGSLHNDMNTNDFISAEHPSETRLRGLSASSSIQKGKQNLLRVSVRSPIFILVLVIAVFVFVAACVLIHYYCCCQGSAIDPDDEHDPDSFDAEAARKRQPQLGSAEYNSATFTPRFVAPKEDPVDINFKRLRKSRKSKSPRKDKGGSRKPKSRSGEDGGGEEGEESEVEVEVLTTEDGTYATGSISTGLDDGAAETSSSAAAAPGGGSARAGASGNSGDTKTRSSAHDDESGSSNGTSSQTTPISVTFDNSQVYQYRDAIGGSNPLSKRASPTKQQQEQKPAPESKPTMSTGPSSESFYSQKPQQPSSASEAPGVSLMDSLLNESESPDDIRSYSGPAAAASAYPEPTPAGDGGSDLPTATQRRESLEAAKSRRPSMAAGFTGAMMLQGGKRGPAAAASRLSGGGESAATVSAAVAAPAPSVSVDAPPPPAAVAAPTPVPTPAVAPVEPIPVPAVSQRRAAPASTITRADTSPAFPTASEVPSSENGAAQSDALPAQQAGSNWRRRSVSSHTLGGAEAGVSSAGADASANPVLSRPPVPARRSSIKASGSSSRRAPPLPESDEAVFSI